MFRPRISEARGCLSFLGNVCGDALRSAKLSAFPAAIQSLSAILDDMDDMAAAQSEFLPTITVAGKEIPTAAPPQGFVLREELGILAHESTDGTLAYRAEGSLFECRATRTPGGEYLLMFPTDTRGRDPASVRNAHYGSKTEKVNDLVALRSSDRGVTWTGPSVAFDIDYNQHGFIPLIPRDSARIYAFGTQPIWGLRTTERGLQENAPIGYRYSDDDGHAWSEVRLIRPLNDPEYRGMSVMRMCETEAGTWLLGTHEADWSYRPLMTRCYLLRSEDRGETWELLPGARHGGFHVPGFNRMDEPRPIHLGNDHVLLMARTAEGHLWQSWSEDDGRTWSEPEPSSLVHPDAPPMVFHLSDGETLIAFHHNRHHDHGYSGLSGNKSESMKDRSEIWFSLSTNGGHAWSEPRFAFVNALPATLESPFRNYQCSYMDAFADDGVLNIFVPHRWQQVLHLRVREHDLASMPTAEEWRLLT